jgi:hypothetical protein
LTSELRFICTEIFKEKPIKDVLVRQPYQQSRENLFKAAKEDRSFISGSGQNVMHLLISSLTTSSNLAVLKLSLALDNPASPILSLKNQS